MAEPTAMEVEQADSKPLPRPLAFNVLHLIKTAQSQHGGRYGDYQRYRRYCSARLRRLFRSLRFLHGKGKYQRKALEPANVNDVRHLHIPLFSAERAWAFAMELKQTISEAGSAAAAQAAFARKRAHLLRRLVRAARWADGFSRLCAAKADSKTALEAEAYASYMWGTVLMERESDFETALQKFSRARTVYEQLGRVGDVEEQMMCRQRAEEMEPSIRFCRYKMGASADGADGAASGADASNLLGLSSAHDGPAADLLQSKLEAVMEEARSREAANLAELDWLGRKYSVLNAKTRVCILKAQQLEAEVASADVANDRRLNLYDKIFVAYHDAKRLIRDDMVAAGGAEDVKEQLAALERAVSCLVLQRTIHRNLLLVAGAKVRLDRQQQQGGQGQAGGKGGVGEGKKGKREKGGEEKEREKAARPEDLIRLYDTLLQNASDLSDLAASGRDKRAEENALAAQLEANKACYQACRAFYVAMAYQAAGKDAEAYVVFGRAATDAEEALKGLNSLQEPADAQGGKEKEKGTGKGKGKAKDKASAPPAASAASLEEREVREVVALSRAQRSLLHARATLEAIKAADPSAVQKGVADLSLKGKDKVEIKYMTENLNEFVSAVAADSTTPGSKLAPHIARVPPPFQAVPCRPIVLDTALNAINFPDLEGRAKKEGKKAGGLFSAFWGGGRS